VTLPPEDGDTFAANALGKARAAAAALGRPAIADDSGIEAEALGGAPGIRSARFAGPAATDADNLAKLRAEAPAGSRLRYVCVMAYAEPGGDERTFEGACGGALAADARGSGGFGYDPAFLPDDVAGGRTMAELSDAEKDAISHRGRAARALLAWLRAARAMTAGEIAP
jgi:XTP/dITP diphosphohydrolase